MKVQFAAALLAGGHSRRMGADKALLSLPDGRRLWERQLGILQTLEPAELFVSGRARPDFEPDVPFIADPEQGQGPLAGIVAVLRKATSPLTLILAIDLPHMTAAYLQRLLAGIGPNADYGVVPQKAGGLFEPLAAIFPVAALPIAEGRLHDGHLSLQPFIRELNGIGLMHTQPISPDDADLFSNWNTPGDLPPR